MIKKKHTPRIFDPKKEMFVCQCCKQVMSNIYLHTQTENHYVLPIALRNKKICYDCFMDHWIDKERYVNSIKKYDFSLNKWQKIDFSQVMCK